MKRYCISKPRPLTVQTEIKKHDVTNFTHVSLLFIILFYPQKKICNHHVVWPRKGIELIWEKSKFKININKYLTQYKLINRLGCNLLLTWFYFELNMVIFTNGFIFNRYLYLKFKSKLLISKNCMFYLFWLQRLQ